MEAALQYVQELERSLPAGSRPLVMHSFRAAMEVGSEQLHMGSEDVAENGEFFRLILLAMRRYLELYAHLAGPHGKARPLAVTHTEFEAAKPLLRQWGMRVDAQSFAEVDPSGVGVVRFDAFARWVMRSQLGQLTASIVPGSGSRGGGSSSGSSSSQRAQAWAEPSAGGSGSGDGPLRAMELNTLALSMGGIERSIPSKGVGKPRHASPPPAGALYGSGKPRHASPPPAGALYGSESHRLVLPPSKHGRGGRHARSPSRVHRSPPRLPASQQTAKSHPRSTVPVRPKPTKFDLAERLSDVGLQQYARRLSQLGFDDVSQLLSLQYSIDPRDAGRVDLYQSGYSAVLDTLNLMPGHRVKMLQFFQNEARNAARAAHERTLDDANVRAREVAEAEARQAEELKLLRMRNQELEEAMEQSLAATREEAASVQRAWERNERARSLAATWLEQGKLVTQSSGVQVIHSAYDRILRPCYEEWRDLSKGRRKARRFLRRLMNRELARAFERWADLAEAIYRLRSIGLRWDLRALAKAFDQWFFLREAGTAERKVTDTMARFARRLANKKLAMGWEAWKGWWAQHRADRDTMRSVAARMANPALSKAFDRWRECAASRADKKAKMLKVLRRHFSEGLSKGWNSWVAYVEPFLIMRRAARALANLPVRQAFNSWAGVLDELAEKRRKLDMARNAIGRLANRELSRGFSAWQALVQARHDAWALLDKVTRRWLLLEATMAYTHWAWLTTERRRTERLIKSFAGRLQNPGVSRAWGSWVEYAEQRRKMYGMAEHWRHGKSAYALQHKVFIAWKRHVHDGFLTRTGRRLWGFEQWIEKLLWTLEGGVERVIRKPIERVIRRRRQRDDASDDDSEDDSIDDDIPNRERRRMRAIGLPARRVAPEEDLPAMDGPYARRRRERGIGGMAGGVVGGVAGGLRRSLAESEAAELANYGVMTVERFPNVLKEFKRSSVEARGFGGGAAAARRKADQAGGADDGAGVGPPRRKAPPPPDASWSGDPSGSGLR